MTKDVTTKKEPNDWIKHVQKVKQNDNALSWKQALVKAKSSYTKRAK